MLKAEHEDHLRSYIALLEETIERNTRFIKEDKKSLAKCKRQLAKRSVSK